MTNHERMDERLTPETVYWTDGLYFNKDRQAAGVEQTPDLCLPCDLYRVLADGVVACPACERHLLPQYRRGEEAP
jgi:hypothetical protein